MKLKRIGAAALAAALMTSTAVTASALDVTADVDKYGECTWGDLVFTDDANGGGGFALFYVNNSNVTEIVIPDTINGMAVTGIKGLIFNSDNTPNLKSVTIPVSVTNIYQQNNFANFCQSFTDVYYQGTREQFYAIEGRMIFMADGYIPISPDSEGIFGSATIHFNSAGSTTPSVGTVKGDADGDGKVTPKDAIAILTAVVYDSAYSFDKETFAVYDFDGDGLITPKDAVAVLRWYANN